jgi:hypothetical protein
VLERVVAGGHVVDRRDGTQRAGLIVGAAVAHHADGADRQQHSEAVRLFSIMYADFRASPYGPVCGRRITAD